MADWTNNKALVSLLFEAITQDADLQTILGTPIRIYDTEAPAEPDLPYLVHIVRMGPASLEDVVTGGEYSISLYTFESGTVQLNAASGRLIDLLNNQILSSPEVEYFYLALEGGNLVETENANVQRYDLSFEVRYTI